LNNLSYLLELDVSNNKIRKLFDFWPPCNLKEADFSFNLIDEIKNLDNFHYLQKLILDSMWIFFFPNENQFTLIYFSRQQNIKNRRFEKLLSFTTFKSCS